MQTNLDIRKPNSPPLPLHLSASLSLPLPSPIPPPRSPQLPPHFSASLSLPLPSPVGCEAFDERFDVQQPDDFDGAHVGSLCTVTTRFAEEQTAEICWWGCCVARCRRDSCSARRCSSPDFSSTHGLRLRNRRPRCSRSPRIPGNKGEAHIPIELPFISFFAPSLCIWDAWHCHLMAMD
ncbi:hypothetical protein KSP40_PGU022833 [Platanthera guangdongensis]|uniref:Uncharacterized protein n=1 Tax=Platanthera guangdongensis TaxID=2320717 RepID=A0ABR2MIM3_9ASPA